MCPVGVRCGIEETWAFAGDLLFTWTRPHQLGESSSAPPEP